MSDILGYKLTQTGFQVQQILDKSDDAIVNDAGIIKVIADEYYGDGSHLTGINAGGDYLALTGGTLTGPLTGTTFYGDGSQLTGIVTSLSFDDLTSTAHTHIISDVNDLTQQLDKKQTVNVGFCEMCPVLSTDISRNDATRTLTINTIRGGQPISVSNPIKFYTALNGVKSSWEKSTPQSVQWSDTKGLKYIYFDSDGVLKSQDTPWSIGNLTLVWRLYWNPALSGAERIVREAYECHTNSISSDDHIWKHQYGAIHYSGLDLVSNVLASGAPASTGLNTCVSLTSGVCMDDNLFYNITNSVVSGDFNQDLGTTISANLTTSNSSLFEVTYNAPDGTLTTILATRFPFHFVGNVPQTISAGGVITPVTNNYFFNYYIYSFQDPRFGKVVNVRSGGQFATQAEANAETWETIKSQSLTLRDGEVRQLYKTTWEYRTAYSTNVKGSALRSTVDLRKNVAVATSTAGGGSTLASNIIVTPPAGYVSTDQQSLDNEFASYINLKTDLTLFNSHTGQTNPHLTGFSDLTTTAHTHTIANVTNLQTTLNNKLNLSGGTLAGQLNGTTIAATTLSASTYIGVDTSEVTNLSNLSGTTVTEVFNAGLASQSMNILDTDIIIGQRLGTGNTYWDYATLKAGLSTVVSASNVTVVPTTDFSATTQAGLNEQLQNRIIAVQTDNSTLLGYVDNHVEDTTIHFTKSSINFSDLGTTAHTHTNSEISNNGFSDVWDLSYDSGNILVRGHVTFAGTFAIKVKYKFYQNTSDVSVKLFPTTLSEGEWVRFEIADYCRNVNRTATNVLSFTVTNFYSSGNNFIGSNFSNVAGAGSLTENQQDDSTTYLSSGSRSLFSDIDFIVDHTNTPVSEEAWGIVHLTGTIL